MSSDIKILRKSFTTIVDPPCVASTSDKNANSPDIIAVYEIAQQNALITGMSPLSGNRLIHPSNIQSIQPIYHTSLSFITMLGPKEPNTPKQSELPTIKEKIL